MSFSKEKQERIENYILELIKIGDMDQAKDKTINTFVISPTTYYRYIKSLEKRNLIYKNNTGKYLLTTLQKEYFCYPNKNLEEDAIFQRDIEHFIENLSPNVQNIWYYAFTEIMNNAIEHSSSDIIRVYVEETALDVFILVVDDGVGIFNNIKNYIAETTGKEITLEEAVRELFAGKFTTKSENHSGEGIFFTSRIMDLFFITSGGLFFSHDNYKDVDENISDIAPESKISERGTNVMMRLSQNSTKNLGDLFDIYAPVEEGFIKTEIKMKNFCEHRYPVSRSQARRIVERLNLFQEFTLDFEDISNAGQAFCHEVFVVFQNKYPNIKINYINANDAVGGMITRVLNTAKKLNAKTNPV